MADIIVVEPFETKSHLLMSQVGNVRFGDTTCTYTNEDELIDLIGDAAAVVTTSRGKYTLKVISAAKKLRIIAKCGALPNNVDLNAATKCGIPVTWTPGSNAVSVAEHALTIILSLLKKLPQTMQGLKQGEWHTEDKKAEELSNKTVGIVGFGQAGYHLSKLLVPYDVRILCFDPYIPKDKILSSGAKPVDLSTLLSSCDVVSLHCHMCEETFHLINKDALRKMKNTAFLVNTGRGPLVDESALWTALKEKWIAGAGLDVFEIEPAQKDNPLFQLDNILITPHMAGWTQEALIREAKGASEEVIRVLNGKAPLNVANPEYIKYK